MGQHEPGNDPCQRRKRAKRVVVLRSGVESVTQPVLAQAHGPTLVVVPRRVDEPLEPFGVAAVADEGLEQA